MTDEICGNTMLSKSKQLLHRSVDHRNSAKMSHYLQIPRVLIKLAIQLTRSYPVISDGSKQLQNYITRVCGFPQFRFLDLVSSNFLQAVNITGSPSSGCD